jgi:hypothetical protein
MFTSFGSANVALRTLTPIPPNNAKQACAVRTKAGVSRLVCLQGTNAQEFAVTANAGGATLAETTSQGVPTETVALVSVPSGADRDVYAITTRGHIQAVFDAPAANDSTPVCPGVAPCETPVDDVIVAPPCGSLPGKLVLRLDTTLRPLASQLVTMGARGGGLADSPTAPAVLTGTAALDNAGCVDRIDPAAGTTSPRQVITIHVGSRNAPASTSQSPRALCNCNSAAARGTSSCPAPACPHGGRRGAHDHHRRRRDGRGARTRRARAGDGERRPLHRALAVPGGRVARSHGRQQVRQ